MTSILQVLPSELLARIFAFLPERQDVAQARLACKVFHELSSPFLITDIIFARRLDTLKRFRELIEHPYFSRHVTRLIYDSSAYDGRLATDWNRYVSRCEDASRNIVDEEWLRRKRHDRELLDAVSDSSDGRIPSARDLPDDDAEPIDMSVYCDQVYTMGCQRHFPDYYSRYKNQVALQQRDIPHYLIKRAFRECPKLRDVVYTDYRGLVRAGETYDSCCHRLFGNTLEPDHAGSASTPDWDQLDDLLRFASEADARIATVILGPHPFVSSRSILNSEFDSLEAPLRLPISDLRREAKEILVESFRRLDTLDLSYDDYRRSGPEDLVLIRLLQPAAQNIRHLALARVVERHKIAGNSTALDGSANEVDFLVIRFTKLRSLELRHFQFPDLQPLQEFLAKHASTLREVRLIEYCLTDRANEQEKLARWAGEKMHLEGVEIITARDLQALTADTKAIAHGRSLRIVRDLEDVEETLQTIEARERLWLAGRPNPLRRSVDVADRARFATELEKWWLRPVHL